MSRCMGFIFIEKLQKKYLLFLVPFFIYGLWIIIISLYGVNIPILDQWIEPGEQIESLFERHFKSSLLYKQYNESRTVIPNIIFLLLANILKEWNVKVEMLIGLTFTFLMLVTFYLLTTLKKGYFYQNICLLIVYNLLLLSPFSFSRWLRGITIHRLIPDACLIINSLIFSLDINFRLKLLLYSIFCIIAQYSFSGGILIWMVSLIFIIYSSVSLSDKAKSLLLYLVSFIISNYFYFRNYTYPSYHPEVNAIINFSLTDVIIYSFAFLGNLFGSSYESSAFIGFIFFAYFTILTILNLKFLKEKIVISWLCLGLYPILLSLLNSITRLPISFTQALRVDYITHLVYLPLSIIALLFYGVQINKKSLHKFVVLSFIAFISVLYINKNFQVNILVNVKAWSHSYSYGKSCLQLIKFYEKEDCIKLLFPFIDYPYPWNLELVINRFDDLSSLKILKPGLVKSIKIPPQGEWGYIDSIKDLGNGAFEINGWAKTLYKHADAVVLGYKTEEQNLTVFDILPTGNIRTDVAQKYGGKYIDSGWSGNTYFKNRLSKFTICNIQAYGFDANENIFYPLANFCQSQK